MASFNNCTFSGNVGRDPEARYFEDGKMVANFSIAVEGRKKDETLWLTVKIWNKPAQTILDYVKKGSKIIVSGELQQETWTKDGVEKSRMTLNCQNFTLLGSKKEGDGGGGSRGPAARSSRPPAPVEEDEVPF